MTNININIISIIYGITIFLSATITIISIYFIKR